MFAVNRRLERRADVLENLRSEFRIENHVDLAFLEERDPPQFLEGKKFFVALCWTPLLSAQM